MRRGVPQYGNFEKFLLGHEPHFPFLTGITDEVRVQKTGVVGNDDEGAGLGDIFRAAALGLKIEGDKPSGGKAEFGKGNH